MNQAPYEEKKIKLNHYFIYKLIGRGATSLVYEAYDSINDKKVAIKKIQKNLQADDQDRLRLLSYVQNEKAILLNCKTNRDGLNNQSHIIEILDSITTQDAYYIVLELCESSLEKMIKENKQKSIYMDEQEAILKILQIYKGMQVLHQNFICHRDLKPANTLLKRTASEWEIKICDFGFGKFLSRNELEYSALGTLDYVAPEVLRGCDGQRKKYNPKIADIYSLGVMFYEMLFNERPQKQSISFDSISFDRNPPLSIEVQNVITSMLNHDPKKRITWEQLNDQLFLIKSFEYSQEISDYFFRKWINKISILDGAILMIDQFKQEEKFKKIDHDGTLLQLKKKKYFEIQKKIKQQEQKEANLTSSNHLKLNNEQIEKAKQACRVQIETMLSYDYLMKTQLLQPRPGQSMIGQPMNQGSEIILNTADFNFELNPDIYLNILYTYIDGLEQIKQTILQKDEIWLKRILSLQFQIKLASDFDYDFVGVVEKAQQERLELLLQKSQLNINNFEQLFYSETLKCGQLYFDQTQRKGFESQVILQQQN